MAKNSRKAVRTSKEEFQSMLLNDTNTKELQEALYEIINLPKVSKDLNKIDFDTENITCLGEGLTRTDTESKKFMGINTLANGLTYLGCTGGGDWEIPLFFIVYYDGQDLRGYIPEKGNRINHTNRSAFGNDEELDNKFAKVLGYKDRIDMFNNLNFDWESIEKDILNRIVIEGTLEIKVKGDIEIRMHYNEKEFLEEEIDEEGEDYQKIPEAVKATLKIKATGDTEVRIYNNEKEFLEEEIDEEGEDYQKMGTLKKGTILYLACSDDFFYGEEEGLSTIEVDSIIEIERDVEVWKYPEHGPTLLTSDSTIILAYRKGKKVVSTYLANDPIECQVSVENHKEGIIRGEHPEGGQIYGKLVKESLWNYNNDSKCTGKGETIIIPEGKEVILIVHL